MEASRAIRPHPPASEAGDSNSLPPHLTVVPSPAEEGFLGTDDYVLPEYNSEVNEAKITPVGKPKRQDIYGTTYLEMWPMDDEHGTKYKVMSCYANDPRAGMWVVKDTAWSMQPEGINEDVATKLMSLGFNVLVKGPEIGSSIDQSQSAYNTHKVLDVMDRRGDLDASLIAVEGYSRGATIGFATNAYAEWFGREVIYSNLTDPCVAVAIGRNRETVQKAVTLPLDLALLGIAVAKGLLNPARTGAFLHTVDLSADGAVQFVRTGRPLMNGEAGKLAAATPMDMQATIAFFRRCRVNDAKVFQAILADRSGVRFVRPEGGHGGALDSRIIGNIAMRFGRVGQQLAEGRTPDELDYQFITHGLAAAA